MRIPYKTLSFFRLLLCAGPLLVGFGCGDDDGDGAGTPVPDAQLTILNSNINENMRLENINPNPGDCDYLIEGHLQVNADLVIDPGVCIVFAANSGLFINVNGTLQAVGTESMPITFTGQSEEKGYWRGIQVRSNNVQNELNHTLLQYAGSDPLVAFGSVTIRGGVAIESSSGLTGSLKVNNTTIQNCEGYGLIVEEGTQLREFSSNTFQGNTLAAVRIDANNVGVLDSNTSFAGNNGLDGVEINASGSLLHDLINDATWVALANGAVYRVEQSFDVEARLTILPGAVLEFEANQTAVFKQDFSGPNDGILIAKGTPTNPITFTGATKTAGYWQGLIIQSNSVLNEMDYTIVEYGGSDPVAGELGNIGLDKDGAFIAPDLTLTNSIIRHSAGCGIVVDASGGNLVHSGNTFSDNVGSDICSD